MSKQAVILAGGFGKRIRSEWEGPKGLIPLWEHTILWYVLDELRGGGAYECVWLVSNAKHKVDYEAYCRENGFGGWVKVVDDGAVDETKAIGAMEDLLLGLSLAGSGGVLVLPCDTVTKGVASLAELVAFGAAHPDGVTVLARKIDEEEIVGKFGNLRVDHEGKLIEFVEKPKKAISKLAAAAIYYYPEKTRVWVKEYLGAGGNPESPGMIIPWLIGQNKSVYVYEVDGVVMDVGRPEEFRWAKSQVKNDK